MRHLAIAPIIAATVLAAAQPISPQTPEETSMSPLQVERTERLLERRVACRGCHTIAGSGGLIGPSLDGLSERVDRTYVLDVIRDPIATIPGTIMPPQPMPDAESERLATYLLSLGPVDTAGTSGEARAPVPIDPDRQRDGAALYARHCAACHGDSGDGNGWNAPNLSVTPTAHSDAALMSARPDDTLFDAIWAGGYVLDKSARMPAFGGMLEPDQIRALVAYIRELCACEQPSWAGGA